MKEEVSEILGDLKKQVHEYLQNPGVTEQYTARELTGFVSSKGFAYFEKQFPDQANKIKASFNGKDLQSRVLMFVLSLVFKNKKIKAMTPPMVSTLIADVMSETTKWLGSGDATGTDGSLYPGLEAKLLQISAVSLENYIEWQKTLDDEELASVCSFLKTKSVEEIDALLQLDVTKRNSVISAFLRLRTRPKQIAAGSAGAEQKVTPLLTALRNMKGGLQIVHDQMTGKNTGSGQEGS